MPFVQKQLADVLTVARASAGTVFDAAGNLVTVAANQPRFDYDPVTKAFKGLLVEEQRTNLLPQSAAIASSPWSNNGSGISASASSDVAPDGSLSAVVLSDSGTAGAGDDFRVASVAVPADATQYIGSVFVRKTASPGYACLFLAFLGGTVISECRVLNTQTGAVSTPVGSSASDAQVQDCGAWWRLSKSITNNGTGTTLQFRLYPAWNATGSGSRDGTATGACTVWGAQLERGAFLTSYIPTAGAAATRAADVVQVIDGLWRGNSAHTLYVEASRFVIQPAGTGGAIFAALRTADVAVDGVFIVCSASVPTTQGVQIWGRAVNILNPAAATAGTVYKLAVTTSKTRCAAAIDGAFIGAATFAELPALTRLFLGSHGSTASFLNGHIRNVQYTDRVISDADLIAVSQKGLAA